MILLGGLALGLWGLWWPEPYLVCVIALALAPVVALVLVATSGGELVFFEGEGGLPKADVSMLVTLPLLALWLRSMDFAMIDWIPACLAAGAVGVVVAGLALIRTDGGKALVVGAGASLWAWSVGIEANVFATLGSTTFVRTEVVEKRDTSDSNYLTLKPPLYRGVPKEVDVAWRFYQAAKPGDEVCVLVHHGAFGWRWWEVDFCP